MDPISPRFELRFRLATILVVALIARVAAGFAVQAYVAGKGLTCVFGDTPIYWLLGRAIRTGQTFVVEQFGISHYALRTPGYPVFLAACQVVFGENPLAIRMVQALIQTAAVGLVYGLVRKTLPTEPTSVALLAAAVVAVEPYIITASALLLSEAIFIPLMMAMLRGLATLWKVDVNGADSSGWLALAVGLTGGLAVLARPSWLLFLPIPLAVWIATSHERMRATRQAVLILLGVVLILCPWWVRNAQVIGKFVPTALWVGASLYDGLSRNADGSSAMEFLAEPDIIGLDEIAQDAELRRRSLDFVRAEPGRVAWLALVKFARYWSPWPNASAFTSPLISAASAVVTLPIFALLALGFWTLRYDIRALTLLGGPIIYFCCLHMIFVSSVRYRVPGMLPAMGLVAIGAQSAWARMRKVKITINENKGLRSG